jgi:transmembrane sensor
MTKERLQILLNNYLNETLVEQERVELFAALDEPDHAAIAKELILLHLETKAFNFTPDLTNLYSRIESEIKSKAPVRKIQFWKYVAAAVFVAAMVFVGLQVSKKPATEKVVAQIDVKAPQSNRAAIQLANGQTVYLDSVQNGQLAMLGDVQLVKLADGKIAYSGSSTEVQYNTLSNPKGSKVIDMAFVDGSHIWLNAGSSVTYPVPFDGNERKVKISGEAYFEVVHNASQPFIVSNNTTEIKVLGTHFNVNAYDNNPDLKVTLLEGSVKVTQANQSQLLKPNQQAIVATTGIALLEHADLEQIMAWKNGFTSFHSADILTVLRELERWYDITTEIRGEVKVKSFYVEAPRSSPLQDVLKSILEDNNLKYEYDASTKKLTVIP